MPGREPVPGQERALALALALAQEREQGQQELVRVLVLVLARRRALVLARDRRRVREPEQRQAAEPVPDWGRATVPIPPRGFPPRSLTTIRLRKRQDLPPEGQARAGGRRAGRSEGTAFLTFRRM